MHRIPNNYPTERIPNNYPIERIPNNYPIERMPDNYPVDRIHDNTVPYILIKNVMIFKLKLLYIHYKSVINFTLKNFLLFIEKKF